MFLLFPHLSITSLPGIVMMTIGAKDQCRVRLLTHFFPIYFFFYLIKNLWLTYMNAQSGDCSLPFLPGTHMSFLWRRANFPLGVLDFVSSIVECEHLERKWNAELNSDHSWFWCTASAKPRLEYVSLCGFTEKTSKMNFANNRLTNLRFIYTNFSSFLSFMVGILQTLTRVWQLSNLLAKVSLIFL